MSGVAPATSHVVTQQTRLQTRQTSCLGTEKNHQATIGELRVEQNKVELTHTESVKPQSTQAQDLGFKNDLSEARWRFFTWVQPAAIASYKKKQYKLRVDFS